MKKNDKVVIGWIHPGEMEAVTSGSVVECLLVEAKKHSHRIAATVDIASGPRVAEGRSQLVDAYLKVGGADWLLMIDADMTWTWEDFDRICELADARERPIVGGLCFAGGHSRMYPTIYKLINDEDTGFEGVEPVDDYEPDTLYQVGATGAAFLMVHRWVYTAMLKKYATLPTGDPNPYPWFAEGVRKGRPFGEDITFCLNAQRVGATCWVDTSIKIGHVKKFQLTEDLFREKQMLEVLEREKDDLLASCSPELRDAMMKWKPGRRLAASSGVAD